MESLSFPVRRAVREDIDALAAIDAICFPSGIAYSRRELESLAFGRQARTLVAESSGDILGFACLGVESAHSLRKSLRGELITIDVLPEFRRARVGTRLHQALEDWLRASGGSAMKLHVSVQSEPAIAFYRRLGYRRVARVPRYYLRTIDAWRMEKALN